jgi:hypothetical protein
MDNQQQQQPQGKKPGCLTYIIILAVIYLIFSPSKSKSETKPSPTPTPTPRISYVRPTPAPTPEQTNGWELFSELGSAYKLNGTTLIVSIFASDPNYSWRWDVNNGRDNALAYDSLNSLGVACGWLTRQANKYGATPYFYYDWSVYNDLFYEAYLDTDMTQQTFFLGIYTETEKFIHNSIDSDALMRKYGAGNVVYLVFVNDPSGYKINSRAYPISVDSQMRYPYEFCTLFIYEGDYRLWPGAIAHEILHCFGAPDLYMVTSTEITQQYADYQNRICSNDIMRVTFDPNTGEVYYDRIVNEISEIDAYYLGLRSYCADVAAWSLGKSAFDR